MRFEKYAQLVAALYDVKSEAGTKIEPLLDHIPVLEKTVEFPNLQRADEPK